MSVTGIASTTTPTTGTTSTGSTVENGTQSLGQADFLQLLATQLSAQDPMQPMDDTQFISQMANFSSLQQMQTLNQSFSAFTTQQQAYSAPEYIGKTVTALDPVTSQAVTGTVTSVKTGSTGTTVTIGGSDFPITKITQVSATTGS